MHLYFLPKMEKKLTLKQQRFVDAYMGEAKGNATQAARMAGYRGNAVTLGVVGAENLGKLQIKEAIEKRQADDPLVLDRIRRLQILSAWVENPKLDTMHRLRAIEILCRACGDFLPQAVEPPPQNIVIQWGLTPPALPVVQHEAQCVQRVE